MYNSKCYTVFWIIFYVDRHINNAEEYYYCNFDKNEIRLDINKKTVLCCDWYEFAANKECYKKDNPCKAFFIGFLETSLGSIYFLFI